MSEDTKGAIRSPRKGTKGQSEAQEKVQRDKQKPKKRYKGTNRSPRKGTKGQTIIYKTLCTKVLMRRKHLITL
jgi:hypothetical protein